MYYIRTKLWEGDAPGHREGFDIPHIKHFPAKNKKCGSAVITFAGGGYRNRALYECESYCEWLAERGIDAFDVEYRVKPTRFPYPLLDARRAVRYVRANAEKFGIDPNKIAVMGSSAGGHMAALVSTYKEAVDGEGVDELDKVDFMPNMQILCYPVSDIDAHPGSYFNILGEEYSSHRKITPLFLADRNTPPVFLWHTSTDRSVDVNGSFRYATKLHELGVQLEMHVYPVGGHGLGMGHYPHLNISEPYVTSWACDLEKWLKLKGWLV